MPENAPLPMFGLSSYAFRWAIGCNGFCPSQPMSAVGLIDFAALHGLDVVQLCDNVPLLSCSPTQLAAIRDHARARGIRLEMGIRGTQPDQVERALSVVECIGANLLRIVIDVGDRNESGTQARIERAAAVLNGALSRAGNKSICLAIENPPGGAAIEVVQLIGLIKEGTCGACVDTMNPVLGSESPEQAVLTLAPHALTVHLKDFMPFKETDFFRIEGTALGQGILNLPELVRVLQERGQVLSWHVELYAARAENEKVTLERERYLVEQSIEYLNRLKGRIRGKPSATSDR